LRRLASAALLAALTALGIVAPAASASTLVSTAKVVIVVGATEGATSTYRSYADQAYAEAIKYTANVTKVYSPNATWAKVKAAAAGANILLYYGHGNGWPSPYTYDPTYATKDGFGLNDPTNLSDNVHKYYGEPSVATLGLAPNAIVLLGNLCYASGNSEPGNPNPTVSVAHQRIDNYAAGFLKGGAKAVIADGHGGLVSYIHGLFTTSQTIHDLWRSVPDFHNHEVSFASSRSPGYTAYSDPDTTSGGYYRSLVTTGAVTTAAVAQPINTGADPATLVVPGRAEVNPPDAPLYAAPATGDTAGDAPLLDLPEGTRLKTIAIAAPATATTPALVQVAGLDDPSIAGYTSAADLLPKDSQAPVAIGISTGTGRLSPNGDGFDDTVGIDVAFSETVSWTLDIRNSGGTIVKTVSGSSREAIASWDGLVAGIAVPDGTYSWTMRGTDAWKNGTASPTGTLIVDTARLAGSTRFATAAAISANTFEPGVPVAYVAYAFNFPDALAGAAAAGMIKGPVLLASATGSLDPATVKELTRLKPGRIVVLGGPSVISDAVAAQLAAYATSGTVTRLAGATRFATAAAISADTFAPNVDVAYVAYAFNFPDALAGAAAAGAGTHKGPVLLASSTGPLDPATAAELTRLKPARIVVLGGPSVIGDDVADELAAYSTSGTVTRLAGSTRFATAAAISANTFAPGVPVAYVAYAFNFPDALAAAAAAGTLNGPVLLASATGPLDPATAKELARLKPGKIVVLGGPSVISDLVEHALLAYQVGG